VEFIGYNLHKILRDNVGPVLYCVFVSGVRFYETRTLAAFTRNFILIL